MIFLVGLVLARLLTPEEYGLLDDLLEAMAELPREAQRYILGVAQGMAMKAEMQQ